ncbi:MAG: reactive intermediate/imine deaminase [Deltaproteobacteria bacterium]|nr:MAG: reactive intermediate/imine deaminase [Deltaproteobacteria bacterium]
MKKQVIRSPLAPDPIGPYSQAVATEGKRLVFLSGQIALGPDGRLIGEDAASQARVAMENIRAVLASAGMDFDNVVKTTIFLVDLDDYKAVNEVYGRYFAERPPARSAVEVSRLPAGALVEIEVVAAS